MKLVAALLVTVTIVALAILAYRTHQPVSLSEPTRGGVVGTIEGASFPIQGSSPKLQGN